MLPLKSEGEGEKFNLLEIFAFSLKGSDASWKNDHEPPLEVNGQTLQQSWGGLGDISSGFMGGFCTFCLVLGPSVRFSVF